LLFTGKFPYGQPKAIQYCIFVDEMKTSRSKWLWGIMAFFYDQVFSHFPPYQNLHKNIINNSNISQGVQVLDAGCGTGLLSIKLAKLGCSVMGIDRSPEMLTRARKKKKKGKIENLIFVQEDLNKSKILPGYSFNKIFLIHSLYIFDNPQKVLENISAMLPPHGELILCNPSRRLTKRELWKGGTLFLREIVREKGFFYFFIFLPIIISMGILNLFIQGAKKKKIFYCWNEKEIIGLLKNAGFKVKWMKESCLSNSHLLVSAVKEI
jgi:ubiquinone/menaquinone biosynthesis C-methylase UbiE